MIIGYSCWGFLGDGIIDTPDGGRSHRITLIKELISRGNQIVMLQKNRDLEEAKENIEIINLAFSKETPKIDLLFVEYRWPIPGRNIDVVTNSSNYTPDLDRQNELLKFYNNTKTPIIIWDKDQKLCSAELTALNLHKVKIFEPSLYPSDGRETLLFPNNKELTEKAINKIVNYKRNRKYDLVYIGNKYERDASFKKYIDNYGKVLNKKVPVYGKWKEYDPSIEKEFSFAEFKGRVGFEHVKNIYRQSFTTVLIAPDRYYNRQQYTQRLFESIWELCIPLVPIEYESTILPNILTVKDEYQVVEKINFLKKMDINELKEILHELIKCLDIFSAEKQANTILTAYEKYIK